jgi:hypothetical protein
VVPARGLEPRTIGLKDRCSNQAELRRLRQEVSGRLLAGGSERSPNSKPASERAGFAVFAGRLRRAPAGAHELEKHAKSAAPTIGRPRIAHDRHVRGVAQDPAPPFDLARQSQVCGGEGYQDAGKALVNDVVYAALLHGVQQYLVHAYVRGAGGTALYDFYWTSVRILQH